MRILVFLVCSIISFGALSQGVSVIKFPELEKHMQVKDTLLVINFWATWCRPCVEELPYFEAATAEFSDMPVRFLMVSLDFKRELKPRVIPFVEGRKMKAEVVLLDEPDYNSWIPRIDTGWTGGIPATLMVNNRTGKKKFYEKPFEKEELTNAIQEMLKSP
jgi:thiol-disulfide isomerase/thioredoxin